MIRRISRSRQLEDFGIDKVLDWAKKSKVTRGFFVAAIPILGGCAKPLAVEEAPLPSEVSPTETLAPTATLAPTETESPFEGLSICRTWREAANCPITKNDFRRISDYVKANYKFPPEALRVNYLDFASRVDRTSFIVIHGISKEDWVSGTGAGAEGKVPGKIYIFESPLSPIGKPYFFNLKKNPPEINYDNLIAVFPVNNSDGSLGTYTIIVPSYTTKGDSRTPEERIEVDRVNKFEKNAYLPPVYQMGWIPVSNYGAGNRESLINQGNLVDSILQETNDPKGKRIKLITEWVKTGIIPKELEEFPMFGSQFTVQGRFF
jgi:hypothetical protein